MRLQTEVVKVTEATLVYVATGEDRKPRAHATASRVNARSIDHPTERAPEHAPEPAPEPALSVSPRGAPQRRRRCSHPPPH